jgi:secreted trypsin-like serine protease
MRILRVRHSRSLAADVCLTLLLGLGACLPGDPSDREGVASSVSSAITNPSPASSDDAVVAIVGHTGTFLVCSATLIAPRLVLTAAHCGVTPNNYFGYQIFVGETVGGAGARIDVVDARTHPMFDAASLANDLTLLYLREPAPVVPKPILDQPLTTAQLGSIVRVVGYGRTSGDAGDQGTRRQGNAKVREIAAAQLTLEPSPSQPCLYDSGGAVFITVGATEYLGGVVSEGDRACADYSRHTRVDAALDFIHGYLADIRSGQLELGQRCFDDAQCRDGTCWSPADEPRASYCSRACTSDSGCGALACAAAHDGIYRCQYPLPSPHAPGAPCDVSADCIDATCLKVPDQPQVCAPTCSPSAPTCPGGSTCTQVDTLRHVCLAPVAPAAPAAPAAPPPSAGCTVVDRSASDNGILWLMAAVAALVRLSIVRRASKTK